MTLDELFDALKVLPIHPSWNQTHDASVTAHLKLTPDNIPELLDIATPDSQIFDDMEDHEIEAGLSAQSYARDILISFRDKALLPEFLRMLEVAYEEGFDEFVDVVIKFLKPFGTECIDDLLALYESHLDDRNMMWDLVICLKALPTHAQAKTKIVERLTQAFAWEKDLFSNNFNAEVIQCLIAYGAGEETLQTIKELDAKGLIAYSEVGDSEEIAIALGLATERQTTIPVEGKFHCKASLTLKKEAMSEMPPKEDYKGRIDYFLTLYKSTDSVKNYDELVGCLCANITALGEEHHQAHNYAEGLWSFHSQSHSAANTPWLNEEDATLFNTAVKECYEQIYTQIQEGDFSLEFNVIDWIKGFTSSTSGRHIRYKIPSQMAFFLKHPGEENRQQLEEAFNTFCEEVKKQKENPQKPTSASSKRAASYIREEDKVGRNDPCPCGSGKKYKKCCGKAK